MQYQQLGLTESMDWVVIETTEGSFNPMQLHHKETVFTLGNGYLGTRGSFEEGYPGDCAATLIHGVYDAAPIVSPELVNCPNWLSLGITIAGQPFRLDHGTVLHYQRWLNLRTGVLGRRVLWQSPIGHLAEIQFERFVSLADPHTVALRCRIQLIDCDAAVEVQASLNGYADNQGLRHWENITQGAEADQLWLETATRDSHIHLGMAARVTIAPTDDATLQAIALPNLPTWIARYDGKSGQAVTIDKVVSIVSSRESAHPLLDARERLARLPDYSTLFGEHIAAWAAVWQDSDIVIEGDLTAQLAIRFNLFQLLAATPRADSHVSIPAKTLSGFAYRGHVFWDTEIFVLPMMTLTHPDWARNLLTYRYHGLEGARRKAIAAGYEGAMYAWESADTGDEATPTWIPGFNGSFVRIWCGELEVHISADVAYATWHYWKATGDDAWMRDYGAEMILDTAIFWASRVVWNADRDRYDLLDVIGPDEYHERVDNNAFTNRLVQWHLERAFQIWEWLRQHAPDRAQQLQQQLDLTAERLAHWQQVHDKLWVLYDPETHLIEQFENFFQLPSEDLAAYEPRDRSLQLVFGIEGANQRQVLKQADVLMLLYLLRDAYDRPTLEANWDYYVPRTDHTYGSSLGPPVHAILACDLGKPDEAYEHFLRSALVDLADVRGNAAEGIHAASAGGVWQAVVFGFGGVQLTPEGPIATPHLPANWTRLKFQLTWKGERYLFDLTPSDRAVTQLDPPTQVAPNLQTLIGQSARSTPIQGVIFDLDGVLTDTAEFHYQAWKRLADEVGVPFDRTDNEALRGVSRRDSLLFLLKGRSVSEAELTEMMDRKNRHYLQLVETIDPTHVLPGVLTLLQELKAAGIKVAIGSASKNAQTVVQRLQIGNWIDAIADGSSVSHPKPAPDVFLEAARQLGVEPTACIVVEDATAGIEAALRAGMWTVGLGPTERVGQAHWVQSDLQGVHASDLIPPLTPVSPATVEHLVQQRILQTAVV